jgi:hypothetical protein
MEEGRPTKETILWSVMRDHGFSDSVRDVFQTIVVDLNFDTFVQVNVHRLSEQLGLWPKTVASALRQLERKGIISRGQAASASTTIMAGSAPSRRLARTSAMGSSGASRSSEPVEIVAAGALAGKPGEVRVPGQGRARVPKPEGACAPFGAERVRARIGDGTPGRREGLRR